MSAQTVAAPVVHRIGLANSRGVIRVDGAEFPSQALAKREAMRRNNRERLFFEWWVWLDATGEPGRPQ